MLIRTEKKPVFLSYPTGDSGERILAEPPADARLIHAGDSRILRPELVRCAVMLAMSASDREMVADNLCALGYSDVLPIAFDNTNPDRIGMCVASTRRAGGSDIAVVLKGTSGDEWFSNFDIGYGAEHRGFSHAADFAEQRLYDYLFTRSLTADPSFFVIGYSRGGAVANLLSKRLCDRYGVDAVRCYTFGSPRTVITSRSARYSPLYSFVRDEDFFTRVPLCEWGYTRFGRSISLCGGDHFLTRYRKLAGEDYIGFEDTAATDAFLSSVLRLAPNIRAYYERRYQVGDRLMSLYDYMLTVAGFLGDHAGEDAADILLSAAVSDFADLSDFLSSGADLFEMLSGAQGIPRCSVAASHSPAAYLAAVEEYLG